MPKLSSEVTPPKAPPYLFIGIDPGSTSGSAAVIGNNGVPFTDTISFGKCTEHEIADWFCSLFDNYANHQFVAAIEKVHAMPQQGVSSTFVFGQNYGFLRGVLAANRVPFEQPSPREWMKGLGMITQGGKKRGDKTKSVQTAHRLWPALSRSINKHNADAVLIAEWCRRFRLGLLNGKAKA